MSTLEEPFIPSSDIDMDNQHLLTFFFIED